MSKKAFKIGDMVNWYGPDHTADGNMRVHKEYLGEITDYNPKNDTYLVEWDLTAWGLGDRAQTSYMGEALKLAT